MVHMILWISFWRTKEDNQCRMMSSTFPLMPTMFLERKHFMSRHSVGNLHRGGRRAAFWFAPEPRPNRDWKEVCKGVERSLKASQSTGSNALWVLTISTRPWRQLRPTAARL